MEKDVVCGTMLDEEATPYFTTWEGEEFYFCSAECKRKFADHPNQYIVEKVEQQDL